MPSTGGAMYSTDLYTCSTMPRPLTRLSRWRSALIRSSSSSSEMSIGFLVSSGSSASCSLSLLCCCTDCRLWYDCKHTALLTVARCLPTVRYWCNSNVTDSNNITDNSTLLTAATFFGTCTCMLLTATRYWQQHVIDSSTWLALVCYWPQRVTDSITVINVAGSSKYEATVEKVYTTLYLLNC